MAMIILPAFPTESTASQQPLAQTMSVNPFSTEQGSGDGSCLTPYLSHVIANL